MQLYVWLAKSTAETVDKFTRQIAYLLSHLMSTIEQLEPQWSQAFLRRTHFMDTDFQGGVLAVFSTSLHFTKYFTLIDDLRYDCHVTAHRSSAASDYALSPPREIHGESPRAKRPYGPGR